MKRRAEIIEAARTVFFQKGLQASTMDEIAARAELSKGTLYLYFKSKEELYVSLLEEGVKLFYNMLKDSVDGRETPENNIRLLLRAFYAFYVNHNNYYEIIFSLQKGDLAREKISDDIYIPVQKQASEAIKLLEQVIVEGIASGDFKQVDTTEVTLVIWGTANGIFTTTGILHEHELGSSEEHVLLEAAADIIIDGLRAKSVTG